MPENIVAAAKFTHIANLIEIRGKKGNFQTVLFWNRLTFFNSFQTSKDFVFCLQVSFLNKLLFDSSPHDLFLGFWETFESKSAFFLFFSFLVWIIWFGSLQLFLAAWQILTQLPFQQIHPCWNLLLRNSSSAPCTHGRLYILLIKERSSPSTYQMVYFYIMCLLTPQLLFLNWGGQNCCWIEKMTLKLNCTFLQVVVEP